MYLRMSVLSVPLRFKKENKENAELIREKKKHFLDISRVCVCLFHVLSFGLSMPTQQAENTTVCEQMVAAYLHISRYGETLAFIWRLIY